MRHPEHLPKNEYGYVSIHASVKDATATILIPFLIWTSFNPRICKRCDSSDNAIKMSGLVSIHASVKDATRFMPMMFPIQTFQSTHL